MPKQVLQFVLNDSSEYALIDQIAGRAVALLARGPGKPPRGAHLHHQMNVSACHASGNPLRLADLLAADDFNFAHDVFGIDRHLDRETGALLEHFSPRFTARAQMEQ